MTPVGIPYDTADKMSAVESVVKVLRDAGFSIMRGVSVRGKFLDIEARRPQFGLTRIYGIDVKQMTKPVGVMTIREGLGMISIGNDLHEYWIIAESFTRDARENVKSHRGVRLFTFDEFEHDVGGFSTASKRPAAKTAIGKRIVANQPQILVLSASLLALIDERIAALRGELPNSDSGKAVRNDAIAQYEKLKNDLQSMNRTIIDFAQGKAKESTAVASSKSFADGVLDWWTKGHQQICERAYDMSMFGTAVAICSMAGSGGKVAVAVSAALVGGKKLADALKGLKGFWQ